MSVKEYSLKFIKFFKYALSLVFNPRDEMNRLVMGVPDDLAEEYCVEMVHEKMYLTH